jgi:hypothetical protein
VTAVLDHELVCGARYYRDAHTCTRTYRHRDFHRCRCGLAWYEGEGLTWNEPVLPFTPSDASPGCR